MIVITDNIEDKAYFYKGWYKHLTALIGTKFDTTSVFENSLSVGHTIIIDIINPALPNGMSISADSNCTLNDLQAKTLVVLRISQTARSKKIDVGIRSIKIND